MKNPNYADSFDDWQQSLLKLKTSQVSQARIHTGFHRFTEIGQVFHNKYIFNNNRRTFQVEIWKMVCTNVFFFQFTGIRKKPGKGNFRELKPKKIPGGASGLLQKLAPSAPRLGNRSVFILDPRLCQ